MAEAEPQDPQLSRPQRKCRAHPNLCRADRVPVAAHPASDRRPLVQGQHRAAAHSPQTRLVQPAQPRSARNPATQTARLATIRPAGLPGIRMSHAESRTPMGLRRDPWHRSTTGSGQARSSKPHLESETCSTVDPGLRRDDVASIYARYTPIWAPGTANTNWITASKAGT